MAADLAASFSNLPGRVASRTGGKILNAVTAGELEPGPPSGRWRDQQTAKRRSDRLFGSILVPVSGEVISWCGLEQAFVVAKREEARILGLHMVASEQQRDGRAPQEVREEFERRCQEAGVQGEFAVGVGNIARGIYQRSQWADLVVTNVAYPPAPRAISRLRSGFRILVQRTNGPLLAVPGKISSLDSALLAFDGSPKSMEALFVATYLSTQWDISLAVITVSNGSQVSAEKVAYARKYLETSGVAPTFVEESGSVADAILRTADSQQSELIIMGGYAIQPCAGVGAGQYGGSSPAAVHHTDVHLPITVGFGQSGDTKQNPDLSWARYRATAAMLRIAR